MAGRELGLAIGFGGFVTFIAGAGFLVIAEREEDGSADERVFFADFTLEEAFVGPVEQAEVATVDDEPGWAGVSLDDVFEFRASVFETGGDVLDNGFAQDLIELGSFKFKVAGDVDFGGELEEFGDVLAGFGAGDEDGGVWQEVEIALEFV